MYTIIKTSNGERLGMTEEPNYIKKAENGCYVQCPEPEAAGVAFAGVPYRLPGREVPESMGSLEAVVVNETDAGPMVAAADELSADIDGLTVEQEYRLTMLELGLAGSGEEV